MNNDFIASMWSQLCDAMTMEKREYGEEATCRKWAISKTRLTQMCHFSKFCKMCRENRLPLPPSPDVMQKALRRKQSDWLTLWQFCAQHNVRTKSGVEGAMDKLSMINNWKPSQEALKRKQVRNAAKTLAGVEDPVAFVDKVGADGLGQDWESGIRNAIEMDQRKMELSK